MIKVINSGKTTNIDGSNGSAIKVGNTTVSDVIANGKLVYHPDKIHIFYSLGVSGFPSDVHIYNDIAFPFGAYCTCIVKMNQWDLSAVVTHNISEKTKKGEKIDIQSHSTDFIIPPAWGSVDISIKPFINDAQTEYGTEYKYSKSGIAIGEYHPIEEYYL